MSSHQKTKTKNNNNKNTHTPKIQTINYTREKNTMRDCHQIQQTEKLAIQVPRKGTV